MRPLSPSTLPDHFTLPFAESLNLKPSTSIVVATMSPRFQVFCSSAAVIPGSSRLSCPAPSYAESAKGTSTVCLLMRMAAVP